MSDWGYVTLAYAVVWGGVALYALTLAHRIARVRTHIQNLGKTGGRSIVTSDDRSGTSEQASGGAVRPLLTGVRSSVRNGQEPDFGG